MIQLRLKAIADFLGGRLIGVDAVIESVGIDTRCLAEGALYIAIQGERLDGHDLVLQAEQAGASALIVNRELDSALSQIIVKNTKQALADLSGLVRDIVNPRVCAVTGSNGKTTIKEMLASILSQQYSVLATQGNFNNEIGVPLTLLRLEPDHRFAVVEMGANHEDEIAYTCRYAKPDVAIISNVGLAHIEGFGCIEGVASAKAEIIESLADDGVAILNADDDFFNLWRAIAGQRECLSFGLEECADVQAEAISTDIVNQQFVTQFSLKVNQQSYPVSLPLAGRHNVMNALAATAASLALGVELKTIIQGLECLSAVQGRMQLLRSYLGFYIINDSYNANPSSLQAALEVVSEVSGEVWLALGAFGELGAESCALHKEMGKQIKQAGVTRLFAVGALTQYAVTEFGEGAYYYEQQEDLVKAIQEDMPTDGILLVKGSRSQKMEYVVNQLLDREKT